MYTIGAVSKMFNIPISTLRYYDKEGLFPEIERISGIRKFSAKEIEALQVIHCLKQSGLGIKDIKQFMAWAKLGPKTFQLRKKLFEEQKTIVEDELQQLQKVLDMIKFKCWYYEQAIRTGDEHIVQSQIPNNLPPEIKQSYDNAHEEKHGFYTL